MKVSDLQLRDFRSYEQLELSLAGDLIAVIGANGSGKTNLVEAIHLALQGFPLRTRRDAAVIRFGCSVARVEARGRRSRDTAFSVVATVDRQQGKRLELDHGGPASVDDLRRELSALAFTPDRMAVVKGGPIVRRTYVDRMLGRLRPARAAVPVEYARALAQRNAALRRVRSGASSRDALAPWDAALGQLGSELNSARAEVIEALAPQFAQVGLELGLPNPTLAYEPRPVSEAILSEHISRDLERGMTSVGPHLADLAIASGDRDMRSYGSQGEQRLTVLALLLGEAHLMTEERSEPPLLVLDDVLSELDDDRRKALLANLPKGSQTIVTSTTLRAFPSAGRQPDQTVEVVPGSARAR